MKKKQSFITVIREVAVRQYGAALHPEMRLSSVKKWVDKTGLDNRIYQTRVDVFSTKGAEGREGENQKIQKRSADSCCDHHSPRGVFSPRGNCPREIRKAFVGGARMAKTENDQLSFEVFRSWLTSRARARARTLSGLSDRPLDR